MHIMLFITCNVTSAAISFLIIYFCVSNKYATNQDTKSMIGAISWWVFFIAYGMIAYCFEKYYVLSDNVITISKGTRLNGLYLGEHTADNKTKEILKIVVEDNKITKITLEKYDTIFGIRKGSPFETTDLAVDSVKIVELDSVKIVELDSVNILEL